MVHLQHIRKTSCFKNGLRPSRSLKTNRNTHASNAGPLYCRGTARQPNAGQLPGAYEYL